MQPKEFNTIQVLDITDNDYTVLIKFQNTKYFRRIYWDKYGRYIKFNGEKHYLPEIQYRGGRP